MSTCRTSYFNNSPFVSRVLRTSPSALDSGDSESDDSEVSDSSTSDTLLASLTDSDPEPPSSIWSSLPTQSQGIIATGSLKQVIY